MSLDIVVTRATELIEAALVLRLAEGEHRIMCEITVSAGYLRHFVGPLGSGR